MFPKSILKLFIAGIGLFLSFSLNGMMQKPALKKTHFKAAGVLPYTRWKAKKNGGNAYFPLAREKGGRDAGMYDSFGGKRDPGEKHPVKTASREFAEESLNILGGPSTLLPLIDAKNKNSKHILVRNSKKYVLYLTKFPTHRLEKLAKNFYQKMGQPQVKAKSEKDALRWVKWKDLETAIANSKPKQTVWVKGAKIDKRTGKLLKKANAQPVTEMIKIRPILVAMLRPFFQHQPYTSGKNSKIRFYQ